MASRECVAERPHLVRDVAVGRDPVRADHHGVDAAGEDQTGGGGVHDHPVRDAVPAEFPGGEPAALQQRTCLADVDHVQAGGGVQPPDDAERGAVLDARERARVAVGEDAPRPGQQPCSPLAERAVGIQIGVPDGQRGRDDAGGARSGGTDLLDLTDAPGQVDGGGTSLDEQSRRGGELTVHVKVIAFGPGRRERHAHSARHAQRHRATHRQ